MRQSINIMCATGSQTINRLAKLYLRGHGGPTAHDENNNTHLTASFQDNPELSVGLFSSTQPNPTHQITDPTQPNPLPGELMEYGPMTQPNP